MEEKTKVISLLKIFEQKMKFKIETYVYDRFWKNQEEEIEKEYNKALDRLGDKLVELVVKDTSWE